MKTYKNENEILTVVRSFENGTISRDEWKHAEHLMVACHYAFDHDYETAYGKMRSGIFNLLKAFGVDLSIEMPYHETITRFWLSMVFKRLDSKNNDSIVELTNDVLETCGDKDLPLAFYSRELLFSDEARAKFVEPDLREF